MKNTKTHNQKASAPETRKLAYYEKSNDSSNYANPLYITHFPDGSTMSTMQEIVARKAVNEFNKKVSAPETCTYRDGSAEAEARRERLDNARLVGWSDAPETRIHPEVDYKVGDNIVRAYSYEEAVKKAAAQPKKAAPRKEFRDIMAVRAELVKAELERVRQERDELRKHRDEILDDLVTAAIERDELLAALGQISDWALQNYEPSIRKIAQAAIAKHERRAE